MRRFVPACLFAAAAMLSSASAFAGDSYTTRIEPRPFYGASVTLEEGVRVFRPLPAQRHVIINPNNAPVYLGFEDRRIVNEGPVAQPGASQNVSVENNVANGTAGFGVARSNGRGLDRGPSHRVGGMPVR